jgi:hypothetical protein
MADSERQIGFEQLGIGNVLRTSWLRVPLNQREYSWTEREVKALLYDVNKAITDDASEYFLGSLVTIPREGGVLEVVDGQQRLATTAIVLSAIRDYLAGRSEDKLIVEDINGMLTAVDRAARERRSKLQLNVTDNEYFQARVLSGEAGAAQTAASHRQIDQAAQMVATHIKTIVATHDAKNHGDVLNNWISFLEHRAIVVLLKVPSESNAYRMFETLNDRGLRTSQSDLVKNYLFGQANERVIEAQQKWGGMRAILESFEDDVITINFLRQMLISLYGHMKESDVYETVASQAKGKSASITFLSALESGASDYAAILNPQHEKWNTYPPAIRKSIEVLSLVRVRTFRPVMLSIARKFSPKEADAAMRLILSASVRLTVAGGARSGAVEEGLADIAHDISLGKIETVVKLLASFTDIIASDTQFEEAFATATVSKAELARYYLRCLETAAKGEPHPFYLPNDDAQVINLEHVLPRVPEGNWPQFSVEMAEALYRRIGNMALLQAKSNSALKSGPFSEKKPILAASPYELTRQIGAASDWTEKSIGDRQRAMAKFAVKTWPIKIS